MESTFYGTNSYNAAPDFLKPDAFIFTHKIKLLRFAKTLFRYRRPFVLLGAFWLLMQLFLFFQYGIVTTLEAEKYIEQADYFLAHGHYETGNYLFYSTQILLIAAAKKLGTGYGPVVVIQMLFNGLSVACLYRLLKRFTQNQNVAFIFTFAFIALYYYQLYNVHLFTESLYFSFSIIYFYLLVRLQQLSFAGVCSIIAGITVLYLTRPVGLFFIPATVLFLVLRFYRQKAVLIFSTAGIAFLVLFYILLNKSLRSGGEFNFLLPYLDERIICGVPTIQTPHQIHVPGEQNSIQGLFYIIVHNQSLFLRLSLKRLLFFFGVVRSYYSIPHNLIIACYFYSLYLLLCIGIKKWRKIRAAELSFLLCLVFLTALTTALSCDEWHNRFIFSIVPFLFLLASFAFSKPKAKTAPYAQSDIQ